jgi:hypothetical protein
LQIPTADVRVSNTPKRYRYTDTPSTTEVLSAETLWRKGYFEALDLLLIEVCSYYTFIFIDISPSAISHLIMPLML